MLGKVLAKWQDKSVEVFWIEQGSNEACEGALELAHKGYNAKSLIAFKAGQSTYEQTELVGTLTEADVNDFISEILASDDGTALGPAQPDGGIRLAQ